MSLEAEVPMKMNSDRTPGPTQSQVFELTMDNDEDQDELNRRLRKPGEPGYYPPAKRVETANSPPAAAQGEVGTELGNGEPR